jgi:hypothetical protein
MATLLTEMFYLGPISYYARMLEYDDVLIEREDNFQKASYRNRCHIVNSTGLQRLTIPVEGGRDRHILYKDLRISYWENWQQLHWRSLETAYSNSPFFEYYADYFKQYYTHEYEYLFEFNDHLMKLLLRLLEIEVPVAHTKEFAREPAKGVIDMRLKLKPDKEPNDVLLPEYYQVFADRNGFIKDVSAIDLVFNTGPDARRIIRDCAHRSFFG